MKPRVLITGGAGFIGSHLGLFLKERHPSWRIVAFDNLSRRGSELNLPRLRRAGVSFIRGDIRSPKDLEIAGSVTALLECSAEPSVLAGISSATPNFIIDNNLIGTVHCLNFTAKYKADFIFLSTSRVYPINALESLPFKETKTRFEWKGRGVSENFPLAGHRSFYGATKLASEFLIAEYRQYYGIRSVINRCGVVAGPWQMGKADQGVVALWLARHFWKKDLSYIGYGGQGKQMRDLLHVRDLCELIDLELGQIKKLDGETFNVGGGPKISVSLLELTTLCQELTGRRIKIKKILKPRPADLRVYVSDSTKIKKMTGWRPTRDARIILDDTYRWIRENHRLLEPILK